MQEPTTEVDRQHLGPYHTCCLFSPGIDVTPGKMVCVPPKREPGPLWDTKGCFYFFDPERNIIS